MTYYELINYLDGLTSKTEITQSDIEYINGKEISLEGERYVRFISQVSYVISERLYRFKSLVEDKLLSAYLDKDNLILVLSPLRNEIEYAKLLINISYIKNENKNEFNKSLIESNNKMIDSFKEYFNDDDRKSILDSYYLEVTNEL